MVTADQYTPADYSNHDSNFYLPRHLIVCRTIERAMIRKHVFAEVVFATRDEGRTTWGENPTRTLG